MRGDTAMGKWQNKIRSLRQHLRGWAKNTAGTIKKENYQLTHAWWVRKKVETTRLSHNDNELAMKFYLIIATILREEEIICSSGPKQNTC